MVGFCVIKCFLPDAGKEEVEIGNDNDYSYLTHVFSYIVGICNIKLIFSLNVEMSWWTSVYDIALYIKVISEYIQTWMKDNGNKGLIWCGFLETQETLH